MNHTEYAKWDKDYREQEFSDLLQIMNNWLFPKGWKNKWLSVRIKNDMRRYDLTFNGYKFMIQNGFIEQSDEMINCGYWTRLANEKIPNNLKLEVENLYSDLYFAAKEIYNNDWWVLDLPNHCGFIGEWFELKKQDFKRAFWRINKKRQREEKQWNKMLSNNDFLI